MDMSFKSYIHIQTPYQVSENISYTANTGYCVFAYDAYRQRTGIARQGAQVDVLIMPEFEREASSHIWIVEVKDFRKLSKPPNPKNLEELHVSLERKFEDSHHWMISLECPEMLRQLYNQAEKWNFCVHVELPSKKEADKKSPDLYPTFISVLRGLIENQFRFPTPNNSPLVILNIKSINNKFVFPWTCQGEMV